MAESTIKNTFANKVNELQYNNLSTQNVIDLQNYSIYAVPSDGYVFLSIDTASGTAQVVVYGANQQAFIAISCRNGYEQQSLFVKKGMRIQPGSISSPQNTRVYFIPLSN